MQYALGLDNGGTVCKAALFDAEGHEIAVASRQTASFSPKPGFMQRDMEALWEANCACIREVLETSGVEPSQVAALAIAGHGKGLYPWGKEGPAYAGILSSDNRAWKYPEKWRADGTFDSLYPQLCQQLLPGQQVSLLAWMKDHEPKVYQDIQWVFSVKDYIRFRLTGEAYSEATDISGSGLMDIRGKRFDRDMLAALGIEEVYEKLPPIRYSSDVCGNVSKEAAQATGLAEGMPVAGGMFDIDACAIAMDVTDPSQLCTITGTWTINEFISTEPITGTAIAMNSLYAMPGYYLIEECSATGAGNLEWAMENLLPDIWKEGEKSNLYAVGNEMVAAIPPEDSDVYFLPFLYGSNGHPLGKASFVGLTSFHNRGHMLRAVFEGAAYTAKVHIDKLLSVRETPQAIRMAGGAVNSPLWVQMFADILNLPVETVSGVKELGALGCAMAGFVASGVYPDYQTAARAMVRIADPVRPDPARAAIYQKKFQKYKKIMDALDNIWSEFEV